MVFAIAVGIFIDVLLLGNYIIQIEKLKQEFFKVEVKLKK
jgi:hypothetical protein